MGVSIPPAASLSILVLDDGVESLEDIHAFLGVQCFVGAHDLWVISLIKRIKDTYQRFQFIAPGSPQSAGVDKNSFMESRIQQ